MTQPTRAVCTPWATSADLPDSKPTLDDDTWDDLLVQASELLYLWSGRQYPGGCTSTVVLDTPPGARGSATPCWRNWEDPWIPRGDRGGRDRVVALLPDPPVTAVTEVTIDDVALIADTDYVAELPVGLVRRAGDAAWPIGARITYTHGLVPPIGGQRAAVQLALELGKFWATGKCKLPERVTSVTRQGLSYEMGPADAGWGTGIWSIDSWLSSVNPNRMTRRASAWSPDAIHARRARTT